MSVSKTERYRQAFRELGVEVSIGDFSSYCKKEFGFEVPSSAFYSIRKEITTENMPVTAKTETPSVGSVAPAIPISELVDLMESVRVLLDKFHGDKPSLLRFIAAM